MPPLLCVLHIISRWSFNCPDLALILNFQPHAADIPVNSKVRFHSSASTEWNKTIPIWHSLERQLESCRLLLFQSFNGFSNSPGFIRNFYKVYTWFKQYSTFSTGKTSQLSIKKERLSVPTMVQQIHIKNVQIRQKIITPPLLHNTWN